MVAVGIEDIGTLGATTKSFWFRLRVETGERVS
jgi:hypothetical protein